MKNCKLIFLLILLSTLLMEAASRKRGAPPKISSDPFEAIEAMDQDDSSDENVDLDSLDTKDTDENVLKKELTDKHFARIQKDKASKKEKSMGRALFRDMLVEYYGGVSTQEALKAAQQEAFGGVHPEEVDKVGSRGLSRKQVAEAYKWIVAYMQAKVRGLSIGYHEVVAKFVEDRGDNPEGVEFFRQADGLDVYHKSKDYLKKHPGYSHDFVKTMVDALDIDL